jgi:anti-sigma B factor antagonist
MRFRTQRVREVTVIHAEGDLVVTDALCSLHSEVKTVLARGERLIVLNLAGIGRMDSSCLGELVASYTSTVARGGILTVAGPPDHVRRLLELTRLHTVIIVCETEAEAIAQCATQERAIC